MPTSDGTITIGVNSATHAATHATPSALLHAPAQKRRKGSAVAMDVRARAADRGEVGVSALDAEAQLLHRCKQLLLQKLVSLEEEEKVYI